MTQDEFISLLRKQAGAPEADSLAEKTLVTAWRMSQAGDSESIKNAENILNFATVEPVIKNLVKQQFGQVVMTPVVPTEVSLDTSSHSTDQFVSGEPQTISIPSVDSETDTAVELASTESLTAITETIPVESVETVSEAVPIESAPVAIDPVTTILDQSSVTTSVTQTQKKESPDDIVSRILATTENRKLSRTEEFEQLIKQTKQEAIKKETQLEEVPAIIHTYDTAAEEESEQKYHSVEERIKADKAEPFFARCHEYLKKAYENGSPTIIASAENQFESLKKRFPEFVELYSDRIAKIEELKTSGAAEEITSFTVSGVEVKKGMTITSSHVYEVESIVKQGNNVMFHFNDEQLKKYKLSSADLERGLETPGIDADVFFDEFRVN